MDSGQGACWRAKLCCSLNCSKRCRPDDEGFAKAQNEDIPVGEDAFTEQQEKLGLKLAIWRTQRDLAEECGLQTSSSMTLAKRVLRME